MSDLHIVTGAGPVGTTIAEQLAAAGHQVRVLTRSGRGPQHPLIELRRVDVAAPEYLSGQFDGAAAVYHCIHGSKYSAKVWRAELPDAEQVVMDEAGKAGAVAVFPESLYSYQPTEGPITEMSPRTVRSGKGGVREELLRARAAHSTATVSVVSADFLGPYVHASMAGDQMVAPILAGKRVSAFGKIDLPHSFTYIPDLAAAMICAAADKSVHNTVLHAPTAPVITQRQLINAIADAAGAPRPKISVIPVWMMKVLGVASPLLRELAELGHQLERPFVLDSTDSEHKLGLRPTPLDEAVATTVAWWKSQA
ncbi:NAD-dependent epimerase/dehydratase family protein [Nocardia sp. XZ_19_369]|uniref:NAD-dependent epimerase/dehydratase family protein n=1 Tax=Nocardia sp. XZ_19_369 TaxID=2769487 RepID=UPI00188DE918|nr:NAD-dependent epimerase/dehydratase family protein [Nocardia sp. XZ_19_369]